MASLGVVAAVACGETLTQISESDVVEVRTSADSIEVGVGRTSQLRAYPLDARGSLLVRQAVGWRSADPTVASVDDSGLVTGVGVGTTEVIVEASSFADTTHVTVELPPILTLSEDSIGFQVAAGAADPAAQQIDITNSGVLPLVGLSVDSVVYGPGADSWLLAEIDSPSAPATLELTATTGNVTSAGTYTAVVWVSATEAEESPADVEVTLEMSPGAAASMAIHDGDGQSAEVATAVAVAPSVLVLDAFDNPVPGADVTFAVTGGGGALTDAVATTSSSGIARVGAWTLGDVAGANQVTASLGGLTPVVFSATGVPGPAARVVVVSGNNQSAVAASAVSSPPSVAVQDALDNGVEGVQVTFAVASGDGSVTGAVQITDENGEATVGSWTLGTIAGPNSLTVSAEGVATPATIDATGLSGEAVAVVRVAGDAQSDTVAATLPVAYEVRVVDENDNGVAGVPVTWSVTGGGGAIAGSATDVAVDTDAGGVSSAIRVLGTAVGTHTVSAAVGGLNSVDFTATATVGSPHEIRIVVGDGQSATVATAVAIDPQVVVEDMFDNPIEGHPVTFTVTGGGGTVSPTTAVMTQAEGKATADSWTLGQTAGTSNNTLTATAGAPDIDGQLVTFTAAGTAGAPASIAIVQGGGLTAITGNTVATAPTAEVRDQYSNLVPGVTVSFSPSGGGSVGSSAPVTNSLGQAATSWTVVVGTHSMETNGTFQNTLTASVSGVTPAQFSGFARYSYAQHVNGMWNPTCTGCHSGTSGGFSGLSLGGTAAQNHTMLTTDATPVCATGGTIPSHRRVSTAAGDTGYNLSVLRILMQASPNDVIDNCGPHSTKVSSLNLDIIVAWIRNGAPNN